MKIHTIRRNNVKYIIDEQFAGVSAHLAHALKITPSEISRRLHPEVKGGRNFGDMMSTRIERLARKPDGWLDRTHEELDGLTFRDKALILVAERLAKLSQEKNNNLSKLSKGQRLGLIHRVVSVIVDEGQLPDTKELRTVLKTTIRDTLR